MAETPDSETGGGRLDRRELLKYTGAGAVTAAVAGCKSRRDVGATDTPGDGGPTPTGEGGPNVLEGQTVTIGVLAPQPGTFPVGTSMTDSAKLALELVNDTGGVAGANLEMEVGDTKLSPGTASGEFSRLVNKKGCHTIFGTFLTQSTLQCFIPMQQNRTILCTTGAAGPKPARLVSESYEKWKYHFRVGPINSFDLADAELEFLEIWADKLGWEKVTPLIENLAPFDPFAETLLEGIEEFVESVGTGGKGVKRTSSGVQNWTPIWNTVENADSDLALVAQALTGTPSLKQWANQKRPFEFGGIHVPDQVYQFWKEVDGDNRYTFTMNAITPQTENTPRTQPFMEKYRKTFTDKDDDIPSYPVYTGPLTYDGIRVWRKAVENCIASEGLTSMPSTETLIPYMEDVRFTEGIVIPDFQFTPPSAQFAHDPQWNSMKESGVPVWQQWQLDPEIREDYGTMHSFAPDQNKTAKYSFPHWIDYPDDHPANDPDAAGKQPGKNP